MRSVRGGGAGAVAAGHGLGRFEEERALAVVEARERLGELAQLAAFVSLFAPFADGLCFRKRVGFGRMGTVVEKPVERNVQGPGILFKSFHGRDGVAVFDARRIAANQAGTFLNVALTEMLEFTEFADSLSD